MQRQRRIEPSPICEGKSLSFANLISSQPEPKVQARNVLTCITDAAPNASCKMLVTWPERFADSNYTTSCMAMNPSVDGGLYVVGGEAAKMTSNPRYPVDPRT